MADDVDSEAGFKVNKAQFNILWNFLSRDYEVGSLGYKVVESVRRESTRGDLDKSVPAFPDACFEHDAKQKNSTSSSKNMGPNYPFPMKHFLTPIPRPKRPKRILPASKNRKLHHLSLMILLYAQIVHGEQLGESLVGAVPDRAYQRSGVLMLALPLFREP